MIYDSYDDDETIIEDDSDSEGADASVSEDEVVDATTTTADNEDLDTDEVVFVDSPAPARLPAAVDYVPDHRDDFAVPEG